MAEQRSEYEQETGFSAKILDGVKHNIGLGFTAFGGPPVHFKIFHDKFVVKHRWIEEQMYQELFSICQAISGPASTKLLYCINLIHGGFIAAVISFFLWSLPGAFGMYGLSVGVSNIGTSLPRPVYALLSGLNASVVGVIALAAVQLSEKAITDKLTRILVFFGGAAGMLYNSLWYFPILMLVAGLTTVIFDFRWLHRPVIAFEGMGTNALRRLRSGRRGNGAPLPPHQGQANTSHQNGPRTSVSNNHELPDLETAGNEEEPRVIPPDRILTFSWTLGLSVIIGFFVVFIVVVVLRSVLQFKPLLFSFFANMLLAGTIIFGGGPVVIPLLREYVVQEGWVSSRDFLIGLAIQQSFPGPNFNFAVYLGSLTAINGGHKSAAGAVLGFVAIFAPGLILVHGTMGIWGAIRGLRWVKSLLRGVNAAAVGLIFTAVYRIWQIGYLDVGFQQGTSLGMEPWWVVVTATSYVGGYWFGVSPPVAIITGALLGLLWYAVVSD